MPTFEELADRLRRFEDKEFGTGATDAEIGEAENLLGTSIRGEYRRFLKDFGWGGVEHLELYGLGSDTPPHLQLVPVTRSEREEMNPRLRQYLIPVMNDGGGNLYCLNMSFADEPPVVFWDHAEDANQSAETDAPDFVSWLNQLLDDL